MSDVSREESQRLTTLTIEPQFVISVKDYAYDESNELHYGVVDYEEYQHDNDEDSSQPQTNLRKSIINIPSYKYFQDGPPWQEDPDIKTPRFIQDEEGTEYEFSITSSDEIHGKAIALFDFEPENDNEVGLREGQIIWISYRHGQGWLVAEDHQTGETGLVPEEYVQLINDEKYPEDDEPRQVFSGFMDHQHDHDQYHQHQQDDHDSDWVDEEIEGEEEEDDDEDLPKVDQLKLN